MRQFAVGTHLEAEELLGCGYRLRGRTARRDW